MTPQISASTPAHDTFASRLGVRTPHHKPRRIESPASLPSAKHNSAARHHNPHRGTFVSLLGVSASQNAPSRSQTNLGVRSQRDSSRPNRTQQFTTPLGVNPLHRSPPQCVWFRGSTSGTRRQTHGTPLPDASRHATSRHSSASPHITVTTQHIAPRTPRCSASDSPQTQADSRRNSASERATALHLSAHSPQNSASKSLHRHYAQLPVGSQHNATRRHGTATPAISDDCSARRQRNPVRNDPQRYEPRRQLTTNLVDDSLHLATATRQRHNDARRHLGTRHDTTAHHSTQLGVRPLPATTNSRDHDSLLGVQSQDTALTAHLWPRQHSASTPAFEPLRQKALDVLIDFLNLRSDGELGGLQAQFGPKVGDAL